MYESKNKLQKLEQLNKNESNIYVLVKINHSCKKKSGNQRKDDDGWSDGKMSKTNQSIFTFQIIPSTNSLRLLLFALMKIPD